MQNNFITASGKVSNPTPSVLITGANGFVGSALCANLVQHGHIVRGAVRRNDALLNPKISRVTVGEINTQTDWSAALTGVDSIIHLAARVHVMNETSADPLEEFRHANVYSMEHLARSAAAHGVKRLVFASSIKVNGEETSDGNCYREIDAPSPKDPYGISKWEAEQALHHVAQETGLEVVIVRAPLVYGPGVKGNFGRILRALNKGMPLPLASVNNLRSLIYVGNLVDALRICAIHPVAAGKTYLLSDGDDISTPNLTRQLALAMGRQARLFPFPVALLKLAGKLLGKSEEIVRLLGSLQIDSGKIRRELDWQPPCTLQQGLETTAEWYRTSVP